MDSGDENENKESDEYVPLIPSEVEMTDEESGMDAVSEASWDLAPWSAEDGDA